MEIYASPRVSWVQVFGHAVFLNAVARRVAGSLKLSEEHIKFLEEIDLGEGEGILVRLLTIPHCWTPLVDNRAFRLLILRKIFGQTIRTSAYASNTYLYLHTLARLHSTNEV